MGKKNVAKIEEAIQKLKAIQLKMRKNGTSKTGAFVLEVARKVESDVKEKGEQHRAIWTLFSSFNGTI